MLRNDDECGVATLARQWEAELRGFRARHLESGDIENGLQFPKHPLMQMEGHPFDTVAWITAPIDIRDEAGKVIFADNVEFPETWGERDKQVVASKYFFGDHGQGFRETSLKQILTRVSCTIALWALDNGTFMSPADAENFLNYLIMIQLHQEFAFNSPVYFNVGVHCYGLEPSPENYIWDEESQGVIPCPDANRYPQISACFIQSVEDSMPSIMKLATSEAMLFKRGSGTGTDLSTLRSSKEGLSCGGTASGPVSFMAMYDRIAAIVKSGGRCLAPEQPVFTAGGVKTAAELAESRRDFTVLSYSKRLGRVAAKRARAWKSGSKEVWSLRTDKGEFRLSADHPVMLTTGEFVPLIELKPGMSLLSSNTYPYSNGYTFVQLNLCGGPRRRELLHRLVAADVLGWDVAGKIVHHDDNDKSNSEPGNLILLANQSEHSALHGQALVSEGRHPFQLQKFDHSGEKNGMHESAEFWRDQDKVSAYAEKQGAILKASGRAADMQAVARRVKMLNTGYSLINAGHDISTFDGYVAARKAVGRRCPSVPGQLQKFNREFGSYESFYEELRRGNHEVIETRMIGFSDVYDIEVDDADSDTGAQWDEHNFSIRPIGQINSEGSCIYVHNSRRAAKMQTLKYRHPDIWEFVECKPQMERIARDLIRAGYPKDFNGPVYSTVLYQNANLSVRVDDSFMSAARDGGTFDTRAVTTGDIVATYPAEKLLDAIAAGSHSCGDPALQFEDTIQRWHTVPNHGPINSSNPCARRGSRLLTAGGWMKVEDLSELESVDIFDGVGFVSGKVWRTGRKGLVRLHMNSGETLDLTPDHRVYTTDGWKAAESCVDSVIPRVLPNIPSTGDTQLPRAITGASGKFYSACGVPLMEALGFLQGDGTLREGIATLHYTPEKDFEYVESIIVPVLSDIAADKGETYYYPNSDGHKFVFSRCRLTEWLQAIGFVFRPLPERVLPGLIWGAKRNAQAAFLRGLFGANGNVLRDARNAVVLVSTCRQMLSEVQLILRTLGIMSSVRIHNKAQEVEWDNGLYVSRESYHLEITHHQDISMFARQIGFPQSSQQSKLTEAVRMERADSRDSGPSKRAFMKVVKVENISEEDDVYDFRTPTTEMGLCNGVVIHNCSEYMHIDDSACNLASLNLLRFHDSSGRPRPDWNLKHLFTTCRVAATAMETMVGRASYPTPEIALNSHRFRPLGGGYCNLGALLMVRGLPYDSPAGRLLGAALASLVTATFYLTSADLARLFGAFDGYAANADAMMNVIEMHQQYFMDQRKELESADGITAADINLFDLIQGVWRNAIFAGRSWGYRNSQSTCLAPTGTIGFMMGCDTLGIEPETALVRYKHLAGGGVLKLVNTCVSESLRGLGYGDQGIRDIIRHMEKYGTIEDVILEDGSEELSLVNDKHLPVFDCAFPPAPGEVDGRKFRPREGRSIAPAGHVRMMGRVTGCVSGAISKTVNMPSCSTIEDIKKIYFDAWVAGCKSISVYRDGSKGDQPVSTSAPVVSRPVAVPVPAIPARFRMPDDRPANIHKFNIMGHEGFITVGFTADGRPGEVFISVAKQGSTVGGLMGVIGTLISLLLQHYVPMSKIIEKLAGQNFEPRGITKNINVRFCKSIVDYVGQYLGFQFVPGFQAGKNPVRADGTTPAASSGPDALEESLPTVSGFAADLNGSICSACGEVMMRVGANCETCFCGHSEGGCGS